MVKRVMKSGRSIQEAIFSRVNSRPCRAEMVKGQMNIAVAECMLGGEAHAGRLRAHAQMSQNVVVEVVRLAWF